MEAFGSQVRLSLTSNSTLTLKQFMSFMAETATIAIKTSRSSAVRRTFAECSLLVSHIIKVAASSISCPYHAPENSGFSQEGFE
jgi:hypothetical protein